MDNFDSCNESRLEKDSEYEKIIHKRRSSIFQSRTNIFDEHEESKDTIGDKDAVEECTSKISKETFNLKEYIISLKNERKEWIDTLKQRKIERKNLTKQKLHLENRIQILDLNTLGNYEKTFMMNQPNYKSICENYNKLSEMAVKVLMLHNLVYNVNQRFILQMEGRLDRITDKIIEKSES